MTRLMIQSGISRQMSPNNRSSCSSQSSGRITVAIDSGASLKLAQEAWLFCLKSSI